jgi:AraC family transcriptional regulator
MTPDRDRLEGNASEDGPAVGRDRCSPPAVRPSTPPRNIGALTQWRLRRVIDFIEAHPGERLALADLARAAGLSRMHFAAQFRRTTGFRPHEYLLCCRVEKAKAMLATSAMPIAQVALAVGFSSQGHFTAVFKRFTGLTPRRWRDAVDGESRIETTRSAIFVRSGK